MFRILFFYFFVCIFYNSGFSQEELKGEIEYTITFKSVRKDQLNNISARTRAILSNAAPTIAILTFSQDESAYKVKERLKNDGKRDLNITKILAGNKDLYFFNRQRNQVIRETSTTGTNFLVEYPVLQWKILDESKEIFGLQCYKAIPIYQNEGKVVAWFTPEIPLGYGPLFYNGLPGLIMEISTLKGTFKVTSINFDNSVKLSEPTEGKLISKKDYEIKLKKMAPPFFENK